MELFPTEMLARLLAGILLEEGIPRLVKPRMDGYGMWGHDSFIPHGMCVMPDRVEEVNALLTRRTRFWLQTKTRGTARTHWRAAT